MVLSWTGPSAHGAEGRQEEGLQGALSAALPWSLLSGGGGGGSPRAWGTTCLCSFPASRAQKWKFLKLIFLIL